MVCEKCGSTVFLVEQAVKHLVIEGGGIQCIAFPGKMGEKHCLRCTDPALYERVMAARKASDTMASPD